MESVAPAVAEPDKPEDQNRSSVWGLVATILWTVVIAIAFAVAQLLGGIVYFAVAMPPTQRAEVGSALESLKFDGTLISFCSIATLLACLPLIVGIVKLKRGARLQEYLGLYAPRLRQLWQWSAITIVFCLLADLTFWFLQQPLVPEFMLKAYPSSNPRWLLWLALIVAAPVLEEICFRGFLFKGLAASGLRWQGATIVTSAIWAAIHLQYDWYGIGVVFGLGLVLGTARAMTNSTLLTIYLHCGVNLAATIQTAVALRQI